MSAMTPAEKAAAAWAGRLFSSEAEALADLARAFEQFAAANSPVAGWHFVFPCAWKLDLGGSRETEQPVAAFKHEVHARRFSTENWRTYSEVRKLP